MKMKIIICFFLIQVFLKCISTKPRIKPSKNLDFLYLYQDLCANINTQDFNSSDTCFFLYINIPFNVFIEKTYNPIIISDIDIFQSSLQAILSPNTPGFLYISHNENSVKKFDNVRFLPIDNNKLMMITVNEKNRYSLEFSPLKMENSSTRMLNSTNTTTNSTSVCGNGIVEAGEQCDDGNTISGDGCSSTCTIEAFYNCSLDNGTYCFDMRPPYCLLNIPYNRFYLSVEIDLQFSKVMQPINFTNTSIANITMTDLNPLTDFTWTYYVLDNKTYVFNVTFKVSFQSQTFTVNFLQPTSIMDVDNITITSISYATTALIDEFIYYTPTQISFFNIIDDTLSYLMIVLLFAFFPLLILDSLSIFWLYIDMLQILNLILYLNIDVPENALVFFKALDPANFIKFEYLKFLSISILDYDEDTSLPYTFWAENFTTNFIHNCFFALFFYALVIVLYLTIKIFNKVLVAPLREKNRCSWFVNICGYLEELMEYSAILRVALITFIPLMVGAIIQMLNLQFQKSGNILNSVLALACLVYLMIFALYTCWFLNNSKIDLEDPEIDKKYQPLFDLLKKKAFFKRNFTIFYMLRKFFWIISLIFLDTDNMLLDQVFVLVFWSLFITTFMYFKKPYEVEKINQLALFTEVMILIILLLIGTIQCLNNLKDNFLSINGKLIIGWIILSIGLLLVLVKALSMIIEILINIKSLVSNTKFFFKNINNNEKMSISAEGDNLIDPRFSRDADVQAIKEVDEEDEDEEKEKEKENSRL